MKVGGKIPQSPKEMDVCVPVLSLEQFNLQS